MKKLMMLAIAIALLIPAVYAQGGAGTKKADEIKEAVKDFSRPDGAVDGSNEKRLKKEIQDAADKAARDNPNNADKVEEAVKKVLDDIETRKSKGDKPGGDNNKDVEKWIRDLRKSLKKDGLVSVAASLPDALVVTAKGTGRTTGHIADLSLYNPTGEAILADIGACFIPSGGQYQPYIVPYIPVVSVPPHSTANIPVQGFCADIHTPPVPGGTDMPPFDRWIRVPADASGVPGSDWAPAPGSGWEPLPGATAPQVPEPMNPPGATAPQVPEPMNPPGGGRRTVLVPGTNRPLGYTIDINQYAAEAAPILLDAVRRIGETYDSLQTRGAIRTPFSGNADKEREAVIQQTFWMYTATLTGSDYKVDDFKKNTIEQYESASGTKFDKAAPAVQSNITQGVDDFWSTFQAVGAEAKVIRAEPVKCTCTRVKGGQLGLSPDCPVHSSQFKH